ncbi:MAG: type II secretion system F family protein [Nitrosomonas halophila]
MENLYVTYAAFAGVYTEQILYALVFFSAVSVIAGMTLWLTNRTQPVDRRLGEIAQGRTKATHEDYKDGPFNVKWIDPLVKMAEPPEGWESSVLKSRLVRAGIRDKNAIAYFLAGKIGGAVVMSLLAMLPYLLYPAANISGAMLVAMVVLAGLIGLYLPDLVLRQKADQRRLEFQEGFPDAMDMLVVCVEAGLGLDSAIQRVGNELHVSHKALSDELRLVSLELRAGKSRTEALRSLADRIMLDDVRALTSILIQAEHFGTSVAEALRQQANEMRTLRLQRAREKAAKLPVKLIFPIMFFIFPALFLVVLGPAAVRIYMGFIQGF